MSCSKTNEEKVIKEAVVESTDIQYTYFLDNERVAENTFNPEDESLYIAITGKGDENNGGELQTLAFSTAEKYIAWGEANGFPVALSLEIENHLREYAKQEGILEIYESTGEVPASYLAYEQAYYERMTGRNNGERNIAMLYKGCGTGSSAPIVNTIPVMWPGWNNKTSSYYPLPIYSGLVIYDKPFYFKRLRTLWNYGWSIYCFAGPLEYLNNRMSSAILL